MGAVPYGLRIELRGGWRARARARGRFLHTQNAYDVLVSLQTSVGVPVAAIAVVALAAVTIGNVVAAGPTATAARTKPARVLRSAE